MSEEQHGSEENGGIRINKFLASCGIDSRRVADRLIEEGRVEVNGKVIDTPGMRVTEKDFVKVDGRHMTPMEEVVVLLNKPRGYVCSREAQGAIGTVYDLLPPRLRHLNYVGRLDADSEGLLIMTNKGELTQTLSHPTGANTWVLPSLSPGLPPRANRAGRTLILMKVMYLIRKILKPGILMNLLRK